MMDWPMTIVNKLIPIFYKFTDTIYLGYPNTIPKVPLGPIE
jgi:hypothetical protein